MDDINPINANTPAEKFAANLDWNLLRTFVVIVDEGSITRAANRLLRQQPAISLALQRLEAQFGTRLIERGRGAFRLTAAGRELYRECVDIYGGIARLKEAATTASRELSGEVTIHLATHVTTPMLDDVLADHYRRHPRITYRLKTASSLAVANDVLEKKASFGICLVNRRLPGLDYTLMYREFFGFFCGPPHPMFGRSSLRLRDLRGLDAVSFETEDLKDVLRPIALLRREHLLDQRIVGQSTQLEEVRRMIQCGMGIGPLPIHVVEREVRDGLLWRLPPYANPPAVDIFLVSNPRKRLSRAELSILNALKDQIAARPFRERTYGKHPVRPVRTDS